MPAYYSYNITTTSGPQPSTAITNQLPGQLVFTQIRTTSQIVLNSITALINAQHKHCII